MTTPEIRSQHQSTLLRAKARPEHRSRLPRTALRSRARQPGQTMVQMLAVLLLSLALPLAGCEPELENDGDDATSDDDDAASDDDDAAPDDDDAAPPLTPIDEDLPEFEECAEVTAESTWCLTVRGLPVSAVSIVGLDSGELCDVAPLDASDFRQNSIGVVGSQLLGCIEGSTTVWRLDLETGDLELAQLPDEEQTCAAATAWDGRPIISTLNTVQLWDRWEDLAQLPADQAIAGDFFASRFSVVGDQLLSAWHSTDTIEIFSLPDGEEVRTVVTEGQEGWIHGLSLSAAGELVTIHNRDEITIFDGETGVFLRSLAPIDNLSGLSCYPARR